MSRRVLAGAALLLGLAGLGVYGAHQVVRVGEMRREIAAMERDLVTLRARTEELSLMVERLRTDPAYVEKLAREELGYVRDGETVLKFPSSRK